MKSLIFDLCADKVSAAFDLPHQDIFAKDKKGKMYVEARYSLYYLCSKKMIKNAYLKKYMEERGYSVSDYNIMYGIRRAEAMIKEDAHYANMIRAMEDSINLQ